MGHRVVRIGPIGLLGGEQAGCLSHTSHMVLPLQGLSYMSITSEAQALEELEVRIVLRSFVHKVLKSYVPRGFAILLINPI